MDTISSSTVLTLGGVLLLMQLANMAINIYAKLRRNPPIDQTLQRYVLREEFNRAVEQLQKKDDELSSIIRQTSAGISSHISQLSENLGHWQRSIERQTGRIESSIESLKSYHAKDPK